MKKCLMLLLGASFLCANAFALPADLPPCAEAMLGVVPRSRANVINDYRVTTYISANAYYPQMEIGVVLSNLAQYLTRTISFAEMTRALTPAEIEKIAHASNVLHKAWNVPHRTKSSPEFDGTNEVPVARLIEIQTESSAVFVRLMDRLSGVFDAALVGKRGDYFDTSIAKSPALDKFISVGRAIIEALSAPIFKDVRQRYIAFIKQPNFRMKSTELRGISSEVITTLRKTLRYQLSEYFDQDDADSILSAIDRCLSE